MKGDPIRTSENHSTIYHLATLHSAPVSAGHCANELAQSLLSVEEPEGRQYSVTSALTDGICKGSGAQRRELSAGLLSVEAGKGPSAIHSSSPFYRGEIDANSL